MAFNFGFKKDTGKVKIDVDRVRPINKKKGGRTARLLTFLVIGVVAALGAMYMITNTGNTYVSVVKLRSSIPQGGIISENSVVYEAMSTEEYNRSGTVEIGGERRRAIILEQDVNQILGKSAAYYIRENTPIYWDAIGEESSKKFSYLYSMDGELLKIDIAPGEFGEMIVPGDRINVRVVYTEEVYKLPTREEIELREKSQIEPKTSVEKQEKLFNNVAVLDMLNSKGASIFDVYFELMSLPKTEQQAIMNSDNFKDNITPQTILLNVTPEEADHYMRIKNKGPQYLLTLLPRTSSNAITELINEITTGLSRNKQEVQGK